MSFPRYPKYKDSGVEWLGEVPEHWGVAPLKAAVKEFHSGGTPESGNMDYWSVGGEDAVSWVAIGDMTRSPVVKTTDRQVTKAGLASKDLKVLPAGTLLYSMYASLGKVAILGIPAAINQAILGIVPNLRVASQSFLRYWLIQVERHLELFSSSNTQANLNAAKVRALPLLVPPLVEQEVITSFLDRETAKIDALVAEQQRLMELLKEKRQAVISHAVTKGLNPDAPMMPSGVEWLGEVPAHWDLLACRGIVRERDTRNAGAACQDYLSLMANVGVIPYADKGDVGNKRPDDLSKCKMVARGDFVINSMNYGIGSYGLSQYDGVCSPVYIVLVSRLQMVEPRFAFRIFENRAFQLFAQSFGNGILQHRCAIGWDSIKGLRVGVPPVSEQQGILDFLDREVARFDELIAEAEIVIDLIHERRSALISAAVTGQIDVRHLATAEAA